MLILRSFIIILYAMLIGCKAEAVVNIDEAMDELANDSIISLRSLLSEVYVMGQFEPKDHPDFVLIPIKYADREGMWMHRVAFDAFVNMYDAAQKEGIKLVIRSAARNFDHQKSIWERKWNGQTTLEDNTKATEIADPVSRALKILLYSSMPGTSRHHWGTDIDLNSFSNAYFEDGDGKKLLDWLNLNASKYGFCRPYTDKSMGRTGYEEERWHWSYKPISEPLTRFYLVNITLDMINGFAGSETAQDIDVINNYVKGIGELCR